MTGIDIRLHMERGAFTLDVEFDAPSTVIGLFGASGGGKTTILRCIAGLQRADTGVVRLNGNVWQDDASGLFVPPHLRGVGYVSQDPDLFPHLSVRENLHYARRRVPQGGGTMTWDDVIEWLAVGELLERGIATLSGGERQRVALARALLASPQLLLLDEPVSALDEPARREVVRYLEGALERLALPVLYVSHSLTEVARLSKHLVWLVDGRVADNGSVSQVLGRLDFARWRGEQPGVVLEATIGDHEEEFQLTTVTTALGAITIHRRPEGPNAAIRLQINARDVSIGLKPQEESSILNELLLEVLESVDLSESDCLVRLGRPEQPESALLAQITQKSRALLDIRPGLSVYARVKSVAVLD